MKKLDYKKSVVAALGFTLLGGLSSGVQAAGNDAFIGSISYVGFNFAPRGYARCDGQLMKVSENPALFALLGTTYGGNGRTTFALPDMRGRVAIHEGSGPGLKPYRLGERGGMRKGDAELGKPSLDYMTLTCVIAVQGIFPARSR